MAWYRRKPRTEPLAPFGVKGVQVELTDEQQRRILEVQAIMERARQLGGQVTLDVGLALGVSGSSAVLEEFEDRAEQAGAELESAEYHADGGSVHYRF